MTATALSPADRFAIQDLLTDLCRAVDSRDPERLGTLVTQDVNFDLGHGALAGRDAVVAAFTARAADHSYQARHTWANLAIESVTEDEVRLTSVFATFAHLGEGEAMKPVWRAGDCHDVVRRDADGRWTLRSRELRVVMP